MRKPLLLIIMLFICSLSFGSVAQETELPDLPGGFNFKSVVPTLIDKCASCHTHFNWYEYGEMDYITQGLVVPGDVQNSPIYFRLKKSNQGSGPRNMPLGSDISNEELVKLEAWINNIGL